MRINNIANVYENYAAQQTNQRVSRKVSAELRRDSIAVSTGARSFTAAMQAIANAPEIREELVSNIRSQIESGTYTPDASKIAEKIIG